MIINMIQVDPKKRFTAKDCLRFSWVKRNLIEKKYTTCASGLVHSLVKYQAPTKIKRAALELIVKHIDNKHLKELRKSFKACDTSVNG